MGRDDAQDDASDAGNGRDDGSAVLEEATSTGQLCYVLRLDPLVVVMTTKHETSLMQLVDGWGGAYSLVFGVGGLVFLALETLLRRILPSPSNAMEKPPPPPPSM